MLVYNHAMEIFSQLLTCAVVIFKLAGIILLTLENSGDNHMHYLNLCDVKNSLWKVP